MRRAVKRYHCVYLTQTEMCVTPRHRQTLGQTLVPQKIRIIFDRDTVHLQTAHELITQVALLRKSRQRKFLISASITASSNQCRPFSSEPPVPADLNTRPLRSRRPCTTPSAAIAAPFNGTCTGSSSARCSTSYLFSLPRPGTSLRYSKLPASFSEISAKRSPL